ncbi:MAG: hypothetical protein ACRD22_02045 [Terriglobia bacterium]
MPQILGQMSKEIKFSIGTQDFSASNERPKLALAAMNIIAKWSVLEGFLSQLFVNMLGSNPYPGAAIYQALTSAAAQDAAFRAIAAIATKDSSQDEKDIFEAILKLVKNTRQRRNKIAHWVWGYSEDIPDGVLLCDPSKIMQFQVNLADATRRKEMHEIGSLFREIRKEIFVYYQTDFQDISQAIQLRINQADDLRKLLMVRPFPEVAAQRLQLLLDQPEVLSGVCRLRKRRKILPKEY